MALPPGPVGLKFWQPRVEATPAGWYILVGQALVTGGDTSGYTGFTERQVITVAAYDAGAPATGTRLRVTVQGGAAAGVTWAKAYVGHAAVSGDAFDFDGTQVQLFWSGNAGGSVGAGSVSLTSDEVVYAFNKTKPLVIAIYVSGPADTFSSQSPISNFSRAYTSGDVAATSDVTADGSDANVLVGISRVDVYSDPVSDSGPVTLPAAGGSYTLTGTAAGLGLGYWITGSDVTFATASAGGTTLAAAAGSYTLTGTAAGLVYPTTLAAAAGSYALTGSAVGLGLGYWLTGSDVTFATATAGGTTLTAAAGAYSLTGTAAAFRLTLAAAANSYALTGSPATFATPFKLPAAGGAYTLTGFDAALTVISGVVLFCGSGSYTLTGFDASLPSPIGPVEPTSPGGVGRGRMIRKFRKRKREEQEEPIPVIGSTPVAEVPPGPSLPPQPGLMAHMPSVKPAKIPKRADPDEDEDEIALLLELLS